MSGGTGWHQLAKVLLKTVNPDDAGEIYQILMEQAASNDDEASIAFLNHQLAWVKQNKGEYQKALDLYQTSLTIKLKSLSPNHPDLAATYRNIGSVHNKMGEYSKALEFHQKDLDICLKSLPPNHPEVAAIYRNIGTVHKNLE